MGHEFVELKNSGAAIESYRQAVGKAILKDEEEEKTENCSFFSDFVLVCFVLFYF